jgi:ribosomal protein S18 acetylase RimI-like enzyme
LIKDGIGIAMSEKYGRYQIAIAALKLPDRYPPPEVVISTLKDPKDYQKVLSLFLQIFPDEVDSDKAMQLYELPRPHFEGMFLAKILQQIIGFLLTALSNQIAYISYLGIVQQYQHRAVATALLRRFVGYLKEQNIHTIRCSIKNDNLKTIGYITYLGFQLIP